MTDLDRQALEGRGSGRTTAQMKNALPNAIFISVNSHLSYPTHLARSIGRSDLRIESPSFLEFGRWRGLNPTQVVLDHACELSRESFQVLLELSSRCKQESP